jgi:hypothetical protein
MFDWGCPAQETFGDEALDRLLGHPMLIDALRLPKERGTLSAESRPHGKPLAITSATILMP